MSIGFNWFESYRIVQMFPGDYWYNDYELIYIGGGSTSHSAGNVVAVQDLIEKYSGQRIPQIYIGYRSNRETIRLT